MRPAAAGIALLIAAATRVDAQAPANDSIRTSVVTYISGASVYVGAGRADGVREGMSLDIIRKGDVVATLRAQFLSSKSVACEIVASTAPPVVGDTVRYHPVIDRTIASGADTSLASKTPERSSVWGGSRQIRGYLGARYTSIDRVDGSSPGMRQPSADIHVEGNQVGGSAVGFVIDARARRTVGTTPSEPDEMRLYEGSTSITHDGSGMRLSVGRQYSAALSSVSLFDGMALELNRPRWGVGAFSGVQPDVATMSFSTTIREAGGYFQLHNAPLSGVPWSLTTGAVESRSLNEINREFAFAQVSAVGRHFSLYAIQEVDYNRGWKRDAGEPTFSPTSSFGTVQIRPADWVSINAGADNRRNVRLYRDFVSPETEFDDAFRQGVWGGADFSILHHVRIGGDARLSRGGIAGGATYYTGTLGVDPLSAIGFEARLRSTRFTTDQSTGWLHSWSGAVDPWRVVRLEINGGLRTQTALVPASSSVPLTGALTNSQWLGASVDLAIGQSWYLIASGTRDGTGADATRQIYTSLVFRF